MLNPISTGYLHCFNQFSMCVQPKLNHVSIRYQRYFNKKSTNFQRLLNQNINHVSTNYHRFFNQFSTSIQRWYLTLKQRWSFNVASTFICNQNSTLFQRWRATLIQRWFNVEMPAGYFLIFFLALFSSIFDLMSVCLILFLELLNTEQM